MYLGGTLTSPCHATGAIAGTLAGLGAGFAARADVDRLRSRLVAAWPAGAALLATYVIASILVAAKLLPHSFFGFGIKWAVLAFPATAVLATIAALAVPPLARSA
jgi:phage shock protein PspC (stress-responsive transcriptional regulator)